jgi:hypothetical protein
MENNELQGCGRKLLWCNLRYYGSGVDSASKWNEYILLEGGGGG